MKKICITVKNDYLHLYTAYQSSKKLNSKAMQAVYIELSHFYQRYDDRMTPYLVQDLYEQIKQVELLTTCDQALLEKLGLDGSVIDHVNQAIENIQGQYRQLHVQNKALFFAQLENIHDQTIKYSRHYIEIEFVQKRIDYGFNQFNIFLRMVVDNSVYRKQSGD